MTIRFIWKTPNSKVGSKFWFEVRTYYISFVTLKLLPQTFLFRYETKKKVEESIHDHGKRSYCERRGGDWWCSRPRQLRQLESKLRDRNIVYCEWSTDSHCTCVFSSGVIAYITIKCSTLDMTHILFDRYCVGKLNGQMVTGGMLLFFFYNNKLNHYCSVY